MKKLITKVGWLLMVVAFISFFIFPQAAKAEEKKKIKIGIVGPMKVFYGSYLWNAAYVVADEKNQSGGVNVGGVMHDIDLVKLDTNELQSIADASSTMERACSIEKCDFVLGGVRTESVLAMQEVAADHKMLYIDCGSVHRNQVDRVKNDYQRYKYYFRTSIMSTSALWNYMLADVDFVGQKIRKELGIAKPKVAIIIDKAKYADHAIGPIQENLPKMGYEVVGTWRPNYMATDLFAELNAINATGAHLIFAVLVGPGGPAFTSAWGKLKIPAAIAGTITSSQRLSFWKDSAGACNYIAGYNCMGPIEMSEGTLSFYNKYEKQFGEAPGWNSPFMESGMKALIAAIEKAGTIDKDSLVPVLEKIDIDVATGRLQFYGMENEFPHQAMYGKGYRTLVSYQWRDGKQVFYFPCAAKPNPVLVEVDDSGTVVQYGETKYAGTGEYELPPWMVDHYKKKN
jgi:branched-chain amino acid transport system substrate-binding protein